MSATEPPIPITVIGGYLGSGKTTVVNEMLRRANGRRIGVVVNDFGELGIDAALVSSAAGEGADETIVNLPNGCVCCTLGDDLQLTLSMLAAVEPRLDHIVVEASGVADPLNTAAWGTVPGFLPGGVVVLAALDSVQRSARDRYVGGEVRRQLSGADLVLATKGDRCSDGDAARTRAWIATQTDAPVVESIQGDVDIELLLGPVGDRSSGVAAHEPTEHGGHGGGDVEATYQRWSVAVGIVTSEQLDRFLADLPAEVLRLKGFVDISDDGETRTRLVQVVGQTTSVTPAPPGGQRGASALEAIAVDAGGVLDRLGAAASRHLGV
jgi:G3E family GTPase